MDTRDDFISWATVSSLRANVALGCLLIGLCGFLLVGGVGLGVVSQALPFSTATPSVTPTPTNTPTPTPTFTPTPTPTPTSTPTPTPTPIPRYVTIHPLQWFYPTGEMRCFEFRRSRRELDKFTDLIGTGQSKHCPRIGNLIEVYTPPDLETAQDTIWIPAISLMSYDQYIQGDD